MADHPRPALGGSFAWKLAGGAARLVAYVLVFLVATRLMSREQYGEAQQILALTALLAAIADFGISGAIRRFLGELEELRPAQTRRYLVRTFAQALGVSVLFAAAVFVLRDPVASWFESPLLVSLAFLAAPLIVLIVLSMQVTAALDGLERFQVQAVIGVLYSLVLGGTTVVALSIAPGARELVLAYVVANALAVVLAGGAVVWLTRGRGRPVSEPLPSSLKYGAWVFLATINGLAVHRINVLVVGGFHDSSEVALYAVADRFFQIPLMGLFLLVGVIAPRAARLVAASDRGGLQKLFEVCNGVIAGVFGLAVAAMFVAVPLMVVLLFPKYPDAGPLIRALLPLAVIRSFGGLAGGGFLIATGHARAVAVISLTATALTLIGDVLLVPGHGSWGAVWVTVAVQTFASIALVAMAVRRMDLRFRLSFRGAREVLMGD